MFHKSKQNLEALFSAKEAEFHNYSRDSVVFQDSLEIEKDYEQVSNNEKIGLGERLGDEINMKKNQDTLKKLFKKCSSRRENTENDLKPHNILQPINGFRNNSVKNIPHNNAVNSDLKSETNNVPKIKEVVIPDFSINSSKICPNIIFEQKIIINETENKITSNNDLNSCNNSRNFYYYEDDKDEKEEMLKIMVKKEEQQNEAEMFSIPKLHLVDSDEETDKNDFGNTSGQASPEHIPQTHSNTDQILLDKLSSEEKSETIGTTLEIYKDIERYSRKIKLKNAVDDRLIKNDDVEKGSSKTVKKHASTPNLQNINVEANKPKVTPLYKYYRKIPNRTYTEIHKTQIKNSRKESCQNNETETKSMDSSQKLEDLTGLSKRELIHEKTKKTQSHEEETFESKKYFLHNIRTTSRIPVPFINRKITQLSFPLKSSSAPLLAKRQPPHHLPPLSQKDKMVLIKSLHLKQDKILALQQQITRKNLDEDQEKRHYQPQNMLTPKQLNNKVKFHDEWAEKELGGHIDNETERFENIQDVMRHNRKILSYRTQQDFYVLKNEFSNKTNSYRKYTLEDYRKLKDEMLLGINTGSLGPDLHNELLYDKRKKIEKQKSYADSVKHKHKFILQNISSRKTTIEPLKPNKRTIANEYSKSVPKPKVKPVMKENIEKEEVYNIHEMMGEFFGASKPTLPPINNSTSRGGFSVSDLLYSEEERIKYLKERYQQDAKKVRELTKNL